MRHTMLLIATALLLLPAPALAAGVQGSASSASPAAPGEARRSGTVIRTARDANTLTFEEMGPWTGPQSGLQQHTVTLTPQTPIRLMQRDPHVTTGPQPDWTSSPLTLADIKPGDFVTVTTEPNRPVAVSVDVVHPSDQPQ